MRVLRDYKLNNGLVTLSNVFFDPMAEIDNDCYPFIDALDRKVVLPGQCCNGNNQLHYALLLDHCFSLELVELSPKLKEQPNAKGQYPVHFAAYHQSSLIPFIPNIASLQDNFGFTPLHIAAEKGHYQHINALIEHNTLNVFNASALHWSSKNTESNAQPCFLNRGNLLPLA
ncbi:ankyrin repeat domain-containing protein [Shewanella sp. VB17]|uniref:ankyrin repeat domain-containing protein n=1 Tax=Shewanella sp. VB17 TaxID=2739432 RepID=UPI0015673C86|nr:ankyrin repeat domain-containing protein [Shewanella sp. VB17]NRD75055.1 ankyrin repeat domain-containing protein [Shewanella sp. VB17]